VSLRAPEAGDLLVDVEDAPPPSIPVRHPLLLGLALVLVGLNLRPALTTLGPVLPEMIRDLSVSPALVGALTTVPVLCLGVFGLVAPALAHRFGTGRAVLGVLLMLAAGIGLRLVPIYAMQFTSAVIAGAGIGIIGVLLPGLVKRDFPAHASLMMGVYTMALCAGASLAAGVTVPIAEATGGWSTALASWAIPAVAAAAVWGPLLGGAGPTGGQALRRVTGIARDPLAWQVTLYIGLQSSLAYIVFGWLAPMLRDRGFDPLTAGAIVSGALLVQTASALIAPILAGRVRHQGGVGLAMLASTIAGILGCLYAPVATAWLWAVLLGIGQGGNFGVALTVIVLRSRDQHVAARLSSMAQSGGYTVASLGPLLVGLSYELTGGWNAAAVLCTALTVAAAVCCALAGRPRYVRYRTS
jgi:CP family cyanate transporter-like MFS transporter